jgi:oligopeptide transport system permease protein
MSTPEIAVTPVTAASAGELSIRQRGLVGDALRRLRKNRAAVVSVVIVALLLIVAIMPGVFATHELTDTDFAAGHQYQGSTSEHWLGTDGLGRDWYTRLVYGARTAMEIGLFSQIIVLAIGLPVGLIAGFVGGRVDTLLMRLTDLAYAFPGLLLILLISQVLGPSIFNIFLAIGLVAWTDIARLVRGQVLSLKESAYILAAVSTGAGTTRIMWRHLLPNTLGPVIVAIAFGIPSAIFVEATLSFLGVGVPADVPSWGRMVSDGYSSIFGAEVLVIAPSAAIAVTLLAFTFLGDGLRDALDPRTR